jgi:hypothetical protein
LHLKSKLRTHWDVLYLGGCNINGYLTDDRLFVRPFHTKVYNQNVCMHAYMVNRNSILKVLSVLRPVRMLIDQQLQYNHAKLSVFYAFPSLIFQNNSLSSERLRKKMNTMSRKWLRIQNRVSLLDGPLLNDMRKSALHFAHPANSGSTSLIDVMQNLKAQQCGPPIFVHRHNEHTYTNSIVLREPTDRFISAFYYATSYKKRYTDMGFIFKALREFPLSTHLKYIEHHSVKSFVSALTRNQTLRSLWMTPSWQSRNAVCHGWGLGEACGFVPQSSYVTRHTKNFLCLQYLTANLTKLTGCPISEHKNNEKKQRKEEHTVQLTDAVSNLYAKDVVLYRKYCNA